MPETKTIKGWYWDDVNKRMYRWHDLVLLLKERELKKQKQNAKKLGSKKKSLVLRKKPLSATVV